MNKELTIKGFDFLSSQESDTYFCDIETGVCGPAEIKEETVNIDNNLKEEEVSQ